MAEEVNEDAVFTDEGVPEEPQTAEAEAPAPEPEGETSEEEAPPEFLKGTPFKTPDALVKSYKDIQRLVAAKDREIQQGKQYLIELAKKMMATRQAQPGTSKKDADPAEFWPNFWTNPIQAIQQLAQQIADSAVQQRLGPVATNVQHLQNRAEVATFMSAHPELTPELEDAMTQVMQENPWLENVPNRLEIAYRLTLQQQGAVAQKKAASVAAVKDAKQAAGMGGKRSALSVSNQGDEFDGVMDLHKTEKDLYRLGRPQ